MLGGGKVDRRFLERYSNRYTDGLKSLAKFQIFQRGPRCICIYIYIRTVIFKDPLVVQCQNNDTAAHYIYILEHSQQTPLCVFMSLRPPTLANFRAPRGCGFGSFYILFWIHAAKVCSPAGDELSSKL